MDGLRNHPLIDEGRLDRRNQQQGFPGIVLVVYSTVQSQLSSRTYLSLYYPVRFRNIQIWQAQNLLDLSTMLSRKRPALTHQSYSYLCNDPIPMSKKESLLLLLHRSRPRHFRLRARGLLIHRRPCLHGRHRGRKLALPADLLPIQPEDDGDRTHRGSHEA